MTTITLNIDEESEKGKALLAFLKAFQIEKEIDVVKEPESPYNKEFVKKVLKGRREVAEGKTKAIETDSIWESIK